MFNRVMVSIILVALIPWPQVGQADDVDERTFLEKLEVMRDNLDKSIRILRKQITKNQTAPFIADLYLQLGDLLAQQANAHYFIHMEKVAKTKKSVNIAPSKILPVKKNQEESALMFERILNEYPKYEKRAEVQYRLVVTYRALDKKKEMYKTGGQLVKEAPTSLQAMQARLLMGQVTFESGGYVDSIKYFLPVQKSKFVYERNAARYRLGLVYIQEGQFKRALTQFELVAKDPDLKEPGDEKQQILNKGSAKANLKREALTDSVRAFTHVFKKNPRPLSYYNTIAPTEELFLHVIEKLAYRYIQIKKYKNAVGLLRTLSESSSNPEKIINTYQDILFLVPVKDRKNIPAAEVQFFVEKFMEWRAHYEVPQPVLVKAESFFEKQVRDMATRGHEFAKKVKDPVVRRRHLKRAERLYQLYLGVFRPGSQYYKMATNLADVYFREGEYLKSGEMYLRIYQGEFGKPRAKMTLLENSILSLQKEVGKTYYDQLRSRALLTEAIRSTFKIRRKKRNSQKLNFTLAKSYYELGFMKKGIQSLFDFVKKFPTSKLAPDASELILDYYNIINDYKGLRKWADRLLALKTPQKSMNQRIRAIKSAAMAKQLDNKIIEQKNYDSFSEAKSYLNMASKMSDSGLVNVVLKKALKKSQEEGDIETFFTTASQIAKKDKKQRVSIWMSMADQAYKIGRYYTAIQLWSKVAKNKGADKKTKTEALNRGQTAAALLRDFKTVNRLRAQARQKDFNAGIKTQILSAYEEPLAMPSSLTGVLLGSALDDQVLNALSRVQYDLSSGLKSKFRKQISKRCKANAGFEYCQWLLLSRVVSREGRYQSRLAKAPASLVRMEREAERFTRILGKYQSLQSTKDPFLATLLTLRIPALYQGFARYLRRVSKKNPSVSELLNVKIKESLKLAKTVRGSCGSIINQANLVAPVNTYCFSKKTPSLSVASKWRRKYALPHRKSDPRTSSVLDKQKILFSDPEDSKATSELAMALYKSKHWAHAVAVASVGSAQFSGEESTFKEIIGCGLTKMKFFNEAQFHLKEAGDENGIKEGCLKSIERARGGRV